MSIKLAKLTYVLTQIVHSLPGMYVSNLTLLKLWVTATKYIFKWVNILMLSCSASMVNPLTASAAYIRFSIFY